MIQVPTYDDVASAAKRIDGHAHRTPVLTSRTMDERTGAKLFFKCENFQRMGAFKFRGGFNATAKFTPEQKKRGVLAFSSGNHAQAIALAAKLQGIPAVIVMPHDAPAAKLAATRGYGAEVVIYDRFQQDREQLSRQIAEERGMTLIPPYDHADVIAGQGTAAKELFEAVGELDYLFTPLGGGGLLGGSLLAAKALAPGCKVYGVEPAAGDDVKRSFESGQRVKIEVPRTIADGAQTQSPGVLTFEIIRQHASGVLTATDEQLVEAMRFFAERMKMIVEPTGALGYCGALGMDLKGARVGVVVSGGNVDLKRFAELVG